MLQVQSTNNFSSISAKETGKIIKKLNKNTAQGVDGIPSFVIKNIL